MLARKPVGIKLHMNNSMESVDAVHKGVRTATPAYSKGYTGYIGKIGHIGLTNMGSSISSAVDYYKMSSDLVRAFIRLFIVVGIVLVGNIFYQSYYYTHTEMLRKAENQVIQLTNENAMLELEVTELKSPGRIKNIATTQLGMVAPKEYIYSSTHAKVEEVKNVNTPTEIRD